MVAVPPVLPVIIPDTRAAVALGLLLVHKPSGSASDKDIVAPTQTDDGPDMMAGKGLTVTDLVAVAIPQPLLTVYDIVTVPTAIPATAPEAFTVAILISSLFHVPPVTASLRGTDPATHTILAPVMIPASDNGLTVTTTEAAAAPQLLVTVYETTEVPADKPVTVPPASTLAIELDTLLHAPPGAVSLRVVVASMHTDAVPVIVPALGRGFIVTVIVAAATPQLLLTV